MSMEMSAGSSTRFHLGEKNDIYPETRLFLEVFFIVLWFL